MDVTAYFIEECNSTFLHACEQSNAAQGTRDEVSAGEAQTLGSFPH